MADILLVPDLEAGNMLAKQLQYLAGADSAGIVCGTRVPIVLTSRADNVRARLASTAVLKLVAHEPRATAAAALRDRDAFGRPRLGHALRRRARAQAAARASVTQ